MITNLRVYDIALRALVAFNVAAAFIVATNPLSMTGFLVAGLICLAVLVASALIGSNPKAW